MTLANDRQVGGTHYKTGGEEHWDRQWRLHGRGYFVGCITKYVERYHRKDGLKDLEKAKHFLEKLIEIEYPKTAPPSLHPYSSPVCTCGTYPLLSCPLHGEEGGANSNYTNQG